MALINLSTELRWIADVLRGWPVVTVMVFAVVGVPPAIVAGALQNLTILQFSTLLLSMLLYIGWIKVMFALMVYPLLYVSPFPGSFLRASFIAQVLSVAGIACQMAAAPPQEFSDVPTIGVVALLASLYIFSSLFFGTFLFLSYKFQRQRKMPWRRLDECN